MLTCFVVTIGEDVYQTGGRPDFAFGRDGLVGDLRDTNMTSAYKVYRLNQERTVLLIRCCKC